MALDRTYLGGIERGERNIALRNIKRLAETLGISLAELTKGLSIGRAEFGATNWPLR